MSEVPMKLFAAATRKVQLDKLTDADIAVLVRDKLWAKSIALSEHALLLQQVMDRLERYGNLTNEEHSCDDPSHCCNGPCRMAGACQHPELRLVGK